MLSCPKLHGAPKRAVLYRLCIEQGLLTRSQVAPRTFCRIVQQFDMLKPQAESDNKQRLAFAKAHANEMWQADTLYGPFVKINGVPVQTRLIAFLDDASRVCCSRPVLPGRECRYPDRGSARRLLQARHSGLSLRRQRIHLHLQGNHPNLCPRRLPASPRPRKGRRGEGKNRKIFPQSARAVPGAANWTSLRSKPSTASSPHWVEEDYNAQRSFRPGHQSAGPLRPGPQPGPLPAAQ